jgi:transposase
MSVNKNVMPLATESPTQQHYDNFSMDIDICIPLRTNYKDYLKHPQCNASAVAELVGRGETLKGISRNLGVSRHIVKRVLRALDMRPNPRLRPPIDPLQHPKIDIEVVTNLRKQDKTIVEIASVLHVSKKQLSEVTRAYAANERNIERLEPRARPNFPTRLDYSDYPKANPDVIRKLITEGYSLKAMAKRLELSSSTIRKVIVALQAKGLSFPTSVGHRNKRTYKHIDYLQHPKCRTLDVQSLQKLGYTKKRIATELRVSMGTLEQVLRAIRYDAKHPSPSAAA